MATVIVNNDSNVQVANGSNNMSLRNAMAITNLLTAYPDSLNPCCSGQWSSTRLYKTLLIINKLKNFTKEIFTFLN